MHKLIEYLCDELETLERKADKDGKLTMQEIQYGDTLAHFKKNLLKADEMSDEGASYADRGYYYEDRMPRYTMARGRRGAKRDSMGRYSSDSNELVEELRELMHDAPNEQARAEFRKFIEKMEHM